MPLKNLVMHPSLIDAILTTPETDGTIDAAHRMTVSTTIGMCIHLIFLEHFAASIATEKYHFVCVCQKWIDRQFEKSTIVLVVGRKASTGR